MYQWFKGNVYTNIVTLSDSSITLNNCAASHFQDVKWCLVGINYDNMTLAIKPVTRSDIELSVYPMEQLHKISVGTGYARVSNKIIMVELAGLLNQPLANLKFIANYDEGEKILVVDLNSPA